MAAYEIKQHFKGLRVETGRRKGRNPFATGFEDDSEEETQRRSRTRDRSNSGAKKQAPPVSAPLPFVTTTSVLDQLRDSDDEWLAPPKRIERRLSPAPHQLAGLRTVDRAGRRGSVDSGGLVARAPRSAVALAAGDLAYLDDSDDDASYLSPRRVDRRPSPAPRKQSDPTQSRERSGTPRGTREAPKEQSQTRVQPSRHTVASPFAGTKYLEDSDSDTDEEAVVSRQNSADDSNNPPATLPTDAFLSPYESALAPPKHPEVKRVDKPKQNGSGVSWRAFSASRNEQRSTEIEALKTSLKQRGKSISFGTHAVTDDGKRVPVARPSEQQSFITGRPRARGKSPPRRAEDTRVDEEELGDGGMGGSVNVYDPREYKTNPFTGMFIHIKSTYAVESPSNEHSAIQTATAPSSDHMRIAPQEASQMSNGSTTSPKSDGEPRSPTSPTDSSAMMDSTDSILSKLTVSPQSIPEGKVVEHSIETVASPTTEINSPLSRASSIRSVRLSTSRPQRIPTASRRNSRRSTSAHTSVSPAHAFLSSWSRDGDPVEPPPEPKPDDEGQAIGLNNEYIIGRTINHGGFGVIKEVHSINERGDRVLRAVKIVRKTIPDKEGHESEKAQQDLEHEVSVWRYLEHRHVLRLHAVYDTDFATFCIMDLNKGGTLHDIVRKSRAAAGENGGRKGLQPKLAKTYAYQLACALRYLHEDIRVCHRDVKLENCLVDMTGPNAETEGGVLRLCDFGLADFLHSDSGIDDDAPDRYASLVSASDSASATTSSVIGTLEYASPKGLSVNRKLYETAGDVWAFGVIVYALCTGDLPFRHPMPSKTVELILRADWDDNALKQAAAGSDAVIDLVKGCLEKDIDLRLTIGEALRNAWFEGCREESEDQASDVWR